MIKKLSQHESHIIKNDPAVKSCAARVWTGGVFARPTG